MYRVHIPFHSVHTIPLKVQLFRVLFLMHFSIMIDQLISVNELMKIVFIQAATNGDFSDNSMKRIRNW